MHQFLTRRISDRLKSALSSTDDAEPVVSEAVAEPEPTDNDVVTTEEEWRAYYVVTAILTPDVPADRVHTPGRQALLLGAARQYEPATDLPAALQHSSKAARARRREQVGGACARRRRERHLRPRRAHPRDGATVSGEGRPACRCAVTGGLASTPRSNEPRLLGLALPRVPTRFVLKYPLQLHEHPRSQDEPLACVGSGTGAVARQDLAWLYPGFPPSCPCSRVRGSVSSSRHLARSMRISLTTRSCTLRGTIYVTYSIGAAFVDRPGAGTAYPDGRSRRRLLRRVPTEDLAQSQAHSAFLMPYSLRLRSCRLLGAFIISPLPHCY